MDYRKIIRSRSLRVKILSVLGWIPDGLMLRLQYWLQTGRRLHLKNPQRFTEKMQLYKLKYRNPDMLRCTDKYEVRGFVEEKGLKDILIPLIGVYNSVDEIKFEELPNRFVAKTTDGGGGNQILICRDKEDLKASDFYATLKTWMAQPKAKSSIGREWAYENNFPRRIVIEELIEDGVHKDIPDYKFYCFQGEPRYCQVIGSRSTGETIDFFDMEWNHMPFYGLNPKTGPAAKPAAYETMKEIARKLSKDIPFARVDLYAVDEKTYFGEVTFYPASGYGFFTPDEWDKKLGDLLELSGTKLGGVNG